MNGLDWLILIVLTLSALLAAAQGFFFEVITLAGTVLGFLLAAWGYAKGAVWFLPYVKSQALASLAAFLTIFLSVTLLAGAIARIIRWLVRVTGLRWADQILGAAFGFLRGAVIITVGLLAVTAFAPEARELNESGLAGLFLEAGRGASWLAPAEMRQKFREGMTMLHGARGPGTNTKP